MPLWYFIAMTQNSNTTKTNNKRNAAKPPSQRKIDQTLKSLKSAFTEPKTPHEYEGVSKSAKKRQSTAIQVLGQRLAELPKERLAQLPLDDSLREAIEQAASISNHEGRRRQLQYVGKLMRFADVEVIAAELDLASAKNRAQVGLEHAAERWRSRIIDDDDGLALWNDSFTGATITADLVEKLRDSNSQQSIEGKRRYRDLYRTIKAAIAAKQTELEQNDVE
jgi:ribosome-associated protein